MIDLPAFNPEEAESLHSHIVFEGIEDRLYSGSLAEYENLQAALEFINASKSHAVIAKFLEWLIPYRDVGRNAIIAAIEGDKARANTLWESYLESGEDVRAQIAEIYDKLE